MRGQYSRDTNVLVGIGLLLISLCCLTGSLHAADASKTNLTVNLGNGLAMEFVLIQPGTFLMGSEKGDADERPVHKVTLTRAFYLGKYEVTQEQWEGIMGNNPSNFKGARNPVANVSWDDCHQFLAKLKGKLPGKTFRLPTEAEWEYACRAGTHSEFTHGDDAESLGEYAWYTDNSAQKTHPVGQKKPNPLGLHDMSGNVWEWCADWYTNYTAAAQTNPVGPTSGPSRVLRGGACHNEAPALRSANRAANYQGARDSRFGFRVVMTFETP